MATVRIQLRRGTAAEWTAANPILAAGEAAIETDTNSFKFGDGTSNWNDLDYALSNTVDDYIALTEKGQATGVATLDANGQVPLSQLGLVVNGAPALLNTLDELAQALGDDANFATTMTNELAGKASLSGATFNSEGTVSLPANTTIGDVTAARIAYLNSLTANVQTQLDALSQADSTHATDTTNVHGIADTDALATKTFATNAADGAEEAAKAYADDLAVNYATPASAAADAGEQVSAHNELTENVHGIGDTSLLALTSEVTAAQAAAEEAASDALTAHNNDTTGVHGITDTAALATKTYVDNAGSALQTNIDAKAPIANPTFTGTVAGVTKAHVGLGNADNTSDANKPVSTATQTALDLKADLDAPTFTGTVTAADVTVTGNLTVEGTTTTISTANFTTEDALIYLGEGNSANLVDLGFVASFNDGTYQHTGLVKDSSDNKWKLFKGVTDEPTTTVNFAQGSLDALKVGAFEATTVTPSSGVVFSDGTQTKAGIPSLTTIGTAISGAYNLSTGGLALRDQLIPISGTYAVTVPTNATTAFPVGTTISFYQSAGTDASFVEASGVTILRTPGLKLRATYSSASLTKVATDTWLLAGDLKA